MRLALGASRGRIARQLLIESVLQSFLGAAAGLILASWDLKWRLASVPAFIMQHAPPGIRHMRIDGYVLAFTAAVAVAAGILAGLAFAWHASRADLNETLKESSRGGGASSSSHRLRGLLVVTEVASGAGTADGRRPDGQGLPPSGDQQPGLRSAERADVPNRLAGIEISRREPGPRVLRPTGGAPGRPARRGSGRGGVEPAGPMELDPHPVWGGRPVARGSRRFAPGDHGGRHAGRLPRVAHPAWSKDALSPPRMARTRHA